MLARLLDTAFDRIAAPPNFVRESAVRDAIISSAMGGYAGVAQPVSYADYVELEHKHPVVAKCVRLNARAVAQGRLRLYRAMADDEEEPETDHPIAELIERVNSELTSFDLIEQTVMSLDLTGNAYWELVRKAQRKGEKGWICGMPCEVVAEDGSGPADFERIMRDWLPRFLRGKFPARDGDWLESELRVAAGSVGTLLDRGPLSGDVIVRLASGAYFRAPVGMVKTPVVELWPLNPARITIEPVKGGPSRYIYTVEGKPYTFWPEQILHFKSPSLGQDFYGLSPLPANVNTIVSDGLQEKANTALLRNAAQPSGIAMYEAGTSMDAIEAAAIMFRASYQGSENAGKVMHLPGGRSYIPMAMSSRELESFDRARWNKSMIQQAMDVYPIVYGLDPNDTSATKENSEVQVELYINFGRLPRSERIERTINERLLSMLGMGDTEDLYVRFDYSSSPLDRKLRMRDAEALAPMVTVGAVTINELRLLLAGQQPKFKPLPWGDAWYGNPFSATPLAGTIDGRPVAEMLGPAPEMVGAEAATGSAVTPAKDIKTQDDALNGAQVTALLAVLSLTAMGQLPREAAIGTIMVCFNLTREEAELVLGPIGTDSWSPEVQEDPAAVAAAQPVAAREYSDALTRIACVFAARPRLLDFPDQAYLNLAHNIRSTSVLERLRSAPHPGAVVISASIRAVPRLLPARVTRGDKEDPTDWIDLDANDPEIRRMEQLFHKILASHGEAALLELDIDTQFHSDTPELREWLHKKTITFADAVTETTKEKLRAELEQGLSEGETYQKLATRVNSVFDGRKDNALTVARTETAGSANHGRMAAYLEADIERHEWLCVDGSTRLTGPGVTHLARRWYNGRWLKLTTLSGRVVTVTANHKILTRRGWVAAEFIHKGDELVCYKGEGEDASARPGVVPHVDDVPAQVHEVFSAAHVSAGMRGAVCRVMDFDSEGVQRDVDVVFVDSELRDRLQPAGSQLVRESLLKISDLALEQLLSAGQGDEMALALTPTAVNSREEFCSGRADLNGLSGGSVDTGLGLRSKSGSGRFDSLGNNDGGGIPASGQSLDGVPLGVLFGYDLCVSADIETGSRHAYDYSTTTHWMVGNGLVIHNSERDDFVRPEHKAIDGDIVDIGQPFGNGLKFPGDGSTGDVGQIANCRCTTAAIVPGADPGRTAAFKDIQWRAFADRLDTEEKLVARQFIRILEKQKALLLKALREGKS